MAEFDVSLERLHAVANDMVAEMEAGLRGDKSSLLMLPTYIHRLPTREESGNFLALDFGGSTCRMITVSLAPQCAPMTDSVTYNMDEELKSVEGGVLFDYLAQCAADFLKQKGLLGKALPLGFTFSFPMKQTALSSGHLIRWTKGYKNNGVIGENVAELLEVAFKKNKETANIKVTALANDTAGTQVAGAMIYKDCHAGLILGTGTNAAYTENVDNVQSLKGCKEKEVVINIEWGNFGEMGHLSDLFTEHDAKLDSESSNAKKQIFEKMISGLYIGELVRLAVLQRAESEEISLAPDLLAVPNIFDGAIVSDFISDKSIIKSVLPTASDADMDVIHDICNSVSKRAADLAAAGVYAIWKKRNKAPLLAAVDGSVFIKHSTFASLMRDALARLGCPATLNIASDGSGAGSAIIAALAS